MRDDDPLEAPVTPDNVSNSTETDDGAAEDAPVYEEPAGETIDTILPKHFRTHSTGRVRIEGVEAGVAAGLSAAAVPPAGLAVPAEAEVLPGEPMVEGSSDPVPSWSGVMPDWRDPPTREVPQVLADHPFASESPAMPGPVWREVESDWGKDEFTFADLVSEVQPIAEHTLSPDEPDPFAFDFAVDSPQVSETTLASPWSEPEGEEDFAAPIGPRRSRPSFLTRKRPSSDSPTSSDEEATAPRASEPPGRATTQAADGIGVPAEGAGSPKRNPVVATVTGLLIGFFLLFCFLGGPVTALALVVVAVTISMAECYQAFRHAHYRPAVFLGLLGVPAALLSAYFGGTQALVVTAAAFSLACLGWFMARTARHSPVINLSATMLGFAWIGFLGAFAGLLLNPALFPHRHGVAYLLGAIEATVAYDVGGYAFGSLLGRHKMAPVISPNKTWEGLIGGCAAAIVISMAVVSQMAPWTLTHAAILGLIVAVFAPIGDLAESMIKRDLGVKDMGSILPAHGGLLDRIDAILFVLPATYIAARLFHG